MAVVGGALVLATPLGPDLSELPGPFYDGDIARPARPRGSCIV
jgi:hypothetical protein